MLDGINKLKINTSKLREKVRQKYKQNKKNAPAVIESSNNVPTRTYAI